MILGMVLSSMGLLYNTQALGHTDGNKDKI